MKLFGILILGILVVQTLGNKAPHRRSGSQGGTFPQKREEVEITEKGSGWGWNGPPSYQTFSCVDPSTFVNAYYNDFYSRLRLWYWTGGTDYGYSLLARILLGRPVASQDELNQMCPSQLYTFSVPTVINNGFGVQFQQDCSVNCGINLDQSTYDAELGVDVFAGYVKQNWWLVSTDNSTYSVWYFCNDGLYGDLQLATTQPYASPEAVAAFEAMAIQYGIPLSQLKLLQCNSPYQGPYPPPFQNYPNGNGWSNNNSGWGQAQTNSLNQGLPQSGNEGSVGRGRHFPLSEKQI